MREIYEVMVSKFLSEMNNWSISVEQPTSFKFQFSPRLGDTQNLNERLLHVFLQDNEICCQAYMFN